MPKKRLTEETLWGWGMAEIASVPFWVGNLLSGVIRCPNISRFSEKKKHLVDLKCRPY